MLERPPTGIPGSSCPRQDRPRDSCVAVIGHTRRRWIARYSGRPAVWRSAAPSYEKRTGGGIAGLQIVERTTVASSACSQMAVLKTGKPGEGYLRR